MANRTAQAATINGLIFKQTIEKVLKNLGASKVEISLITFKRAAMTDCYGSASKGIIEAWWPDNTKAGIQIDPLHFDHIMHIEDAKGAQGYAVSVARSIITSRIDLSLKDFHVSVPLKDL